MPTNGLSVKPLEVKLLAGEQKATEIMWARFSVRLGWRALITGDGTRLQVLIPHYGETIIEKKERDLCAWLLKLLSLVAA